MPNNRLNIIAAVAVVALLFLIYLVVSYDSGAPQVAEQEPAPRVADPAPPPAPEPVVAPPEPEPEPVAEPPEPEIAAVEEPEPEPVIEPEPEPEPEPQLPELSASDEFVLARLRELEAGARLMRVITTEEVVRKFVIFTDNISRGILPQRENPVQGPEQPIEARRLDEDLYVMEPGTHARFNSLMDTFLAVDVERAVMLYRSLLPLLQEAYAEMGYPRREFTDTLVQAIDRVLEASGAEGPLRLVRPSVMYLYADEELESRSDVEKLLLRLGPENTEKLKRRLREFRERLAAME